MAGVPTGLLDSGLGLFDSGLALLGHSLWLLGWRDEGTERGKEGLRKGSSWSSGER